MRPLVALAALCLAAPAHATFIRFTSINADEADDFFRVTAEPTDTRSSSSYSVRGLNDWPRNGWVGFVPWPTPLFSEPGRVPAVFGLADLYVPIEDDAFSFSPYDSGLLYVNVDLTEFRQAGDTTIHLVLDNTGDVAEHFHMITIESPNLGTVVREYPLLTTIPEPSGWALAVLGLLTIRRRAA